jgi:hypothetical protein
MSGEMPDGPLQVLILGVIFQGGFPVLNIEKYF